MHTYTLSPIPTCLFYQLRVLLSFVALTYYYEKVDRSFQSKAIDGTHRAVRCTVDALWYRISRSHTHQITNIDSLMLDTLWSQQRQDAVCIRYLIVMSLCCYCYVSNSAVGF